MKIDIQNLDASIGDKRQPSPSQANGDKPFSNYLHEATADKTAPTSQSNLSLESYYRSLAPGQPFTASGAIAAGVRGEVLPFTYPDGYIVPEYLDKLARQQGLTALEVGNLFSAYTVTMHKLKEQGQSLESQDPVALFQRVVQLASEFDQNAQNGMPSRLPELAKKMLAAKGIALNFPLKG
ncbi:MAG: hypothetical protein ACYC2R_05960 [Burkholderiales bacterium]